MGAQLAYGRPVGIWAPSWHMGAQLAYGCPVGIWAANWHMGALLAYGCPVGMYRLTPGSEVVQDIPEAVYSTTRGGAQGG